MLDDVNGADFRFQFRYGRRAVGHNHQQQIHRYLLDWFHRHRTDVAIAIVTVIDPNDFRIGCTTLQAMRSLRRFLIVPAIDLNDDEIGQYSQYAKYYSIDCPSMVGNLSIQ